MHIHIQEIEMSGMRANALANRGSICKLATEWRP